MSARAPKYVFVTGGVVSALGKGIVAASLGRLLKARGLRVQLQKFDPYLNVDPGTMSPFQHGEVFVTEDGAETASGGELSRIALAIAAVAGGETLIFDEIDAGIGGETANAVGRSLKRLAERAQVVTITHLPQIAALADRHFRVEKVPGDPTHTRIEQLGDEARKGELERMLGGQEFLASVR